MKRARKEWNRWFLDIAGMALVLAVGAVIIVVGLVLQSLAAR